MICVYGCVYMGVCPTSNPYTTNGYPSDSTLLVNSGLQIPVGLVVSLWDRGFLFIFPKGENRNLGREGDRDTAPQRRKKEQII